MNNDLYVSRINEFSKILEEYNEAIKNDGTILNIETIIKNIKSQGGISLKYLKELTWEDIEACGVPRLLAKQTAKIFRKEELPQTSNVTNNKAANMSYLELIQNYDPNNDNAVAKRLLEASKGKKFIVFNRDKTINHEQSLTLLKELKEFGERNSVYIENEIHKTYKVGDNPNLIYHINPLAPYHNLRPSDETCTVSGRSWQGIPLVIRQLVYLAVNQKEIVVSNVKDIHHVLDLIENSTFQKLAVRFEKAALEFKTLSEENRLPSLTTNQTTFGMTTDKQSKNDPFYETSK